MTHAKPVHIGCSELMRIGRNAERTLKRRTRSECVKLLAKPTVSIVYFDAVMLFEEKAICE